MFNSTLVMLSLRHALALALGCLLARTSAHAQANEHQGLTGNIVLGATRYRLDDRLSPKHFAGGLVAGYRIRLLRRGTRTLSFTPQVGLTITEFKGIELNTDQVGFSRLDVLGGQLALRLGPLRPYVTAHHGRTTIERYVDRELVNYYGSMPSYGAGLELPRTNACDAGFDVAVRRTIGNLDQFETRGKAPRQGGSISNTMVTIGWSGRFRGTRWLFTCR